jgi:hypothetical protein
MRSPINIYDIIKSAPVENNNNNYSKKTSKFTKHFINSDINTLNIKPPGLLPSDNETDDYDTYSLSEITEISNIRQEIDVTAVTKNKKRKNLIVSFFVFFWRGFGLQLFVSKLSVFNEIICSTKIQFYFNIYFSQNCFIFVF